MSSPLVFLPEEELQKLRDLETDKLAMYFGVPGEMIILRLRLE